MPIISDRVYMTEQAYMVIAGAALIRGAKSQALSSHDIGGPHVHVHISNCADERVPDDEAMIYKIKQEISKLPTSAADYYRGSQKKSRNRNIMWVIFPDLCPNPCVKPYDMREILARLLDDSLFYEFDRRGTAKKLSAALVAFVELFIGFWPIHYRYFSHPEKTRSKTGQVAFYIEKV